MNPQGIFAFAGIPIKLIDAINKQQPKNKDMKTASLPSAINGLSSDCQQILSGTAIASNLQLKPIVISKAKRTLWLIAMLAAFIIANLFFVSTAIGQTVSLYMQNTQTQSGTGTYVRDLSLTQASAGIVQSQGNASTALTEVLAFTINYSSLTSVINGNQFNVSVSQTLSSTNSVARFRLQRVNSSGIVQGSTGYSNQFNSSGTETATLIFSSSQTWASTDRLRLSIEVARSTTGTTARTITVNTGNPSSFVQYTTTCDPPEITCPTAISAFINPATGLINAYPFNETTGTTANDVIGNKDGTFVNSPSWNTQGKYSGAVLFDGGASGTASDYIDLPDGIVSGLSSNYTISTWVYMNSNSGSYSYVRIFDFGNSSTTGYVYLCPRTGTNGGVQFSISQTTYTAEQSLSYTTPLSLTTWHHIVITVQGNTGTMYLDGTAVATNPNMTLKPSVLGNTANNYFGKSQYSTDGYFSGRIDEFRIYNIALTGAQVTALYNKANSCDVAADLGSGGLGSPTVTGGCGAVTVTNDATFPLSQGSHTITWTATDASSNSSSCTQSVTVIPSTVTFTGILADQCVSNTTYTLTGGSPEGGTYSGTGVTGTNFNASVAGIGTFTITYTYTYIYADGTSCQGGTTTNTINVNSLPAASVINQTNISCYGANDGEITIQASGGTGPYSYSVDNGANWESAPDNTYTFGGLSANQEYRIKVKDTKACESPEIP